MAECELFPRNTAESGGRLVNYRAFVFPEIAMYLISCARVYVLSNPTAIIITS